MKTKRINLNRPTGINRVVRAVDINYRDGIVSLTGLNSHLDPRVLLEIPSEDLGEVIQSLETIQEEVENGPKA